MPYIGLSGRFLQAQTYHIHDERLRINVRRSSGTRGIWIDLKETFSSPSITSDPSEKGYAL